MLTSSTPCAFRSTPLLMAQWINPCTVNKHMHTSTIASHDSRHNLAPPSYGLNFLPPNLPFSPSTAAGVPPTSLPAQKLNDFALCCARGLFRHKHRRRHHRGGGKFAGGRFPLGGISCTELCCLGKTKLAAWSRDRFILRQRGPGPPGARGRQDPGQRRHAVLTSDRSQTLKTKAEGRLNDSRLSDSVTLSAALILYGRMSTISEMSGRKTDKDPWQRAQHTHDFKCLVLIAKCPGQGLQQPLVRTTLKSQVFHTRLTALPHLSFVFSFTRGLCPVADAKNQRKFEAKWQIAFVRCVIPHRSPKIQGVDYQPALSRRTSRAYRKKCCSLLWKPSPGPKPLRMQTLHRSTFTTAL